MLTRTVVALVALFLACSLVRAAEGPTLPEGVKGFKGTLAGTVVKVTPDARGAVIKVEKATPADGSAAKDAAAAVGQELLVNVQWQKGASGQYHPVESQVKFIKSLEPGKAVTVSVVNDEGGRLHLTEVPAAPAAK